MPRLDALFACEELRQDKRLRLACAALLLFYCATFAEWRGHLFLSTTGAENLSHIPSWVFDKLGGPVLMNLFWTELYFALLFLLALGGVLLLFGTGCLAPVLILAIVFVNKAYYYLGDLRLINDWHHIHLIMTFVFLISRAKLFFFRLGLLTCYLLLASTRLSPSWPLGETAGSMGGVLWELFGPLFWFSTRKPLRRLSVAAFAVLHAQAVPSGGPQGAFLMLPVLFSAFWDFHEPIHTSYRFSKDHLRSWIFLCGALMAGLWHFILPGDARLTGEGRLLAFSMPAVNAGKSCRVEIEKGKRRLVLTVHWPGGRPAFSQDGQPAHQGTAYSAEVYDGTELVQRLPRDVIVRDGSQVIWDPRFFLNLPDHAVEPYWLYSHGKRICRDYQPDRLAIAFSVGLEPRPGPVPLLEIPDFCRLDPSYNPLWHNDWIHLP